MFKITPEKVTAVLAVSETCVDKIITLYHSSLFTGHQGVIETYLTLSDQFFIPNLVTNYLIMVPIFQARSKEIGEALIENVRTKYCIPAYIIMDQDSAFMSSLMTYLLDKFNIKIKTVAPYNH